MYLCVCLCLCVCGWKRRVHVKAAGRARCPCNIYNLVTLNKNIPNVSITATIIFFQSIFLSLFFKKQQNKRSAETKHLPGASSRSNVSRSNVSHSNVSHSNAPHSNALLHRRHNERPPPALLAWRRGPVCWDAILCGDLFPVPPACVDAAGSDY